MKNRIFTIIKKELSRFFGDRRLMVSILMPGILIYVLYSVMGSAMGDMFAVEESFIPTVAVQNLPDSVSALLEAANIPSMEAEDPDRAKDAVAQQELNLLLVFPEDFDATVAAYTPSAGIAPQVEMYYNSTDNHSQSAADMVGTLLSVYEDSLANKFDINTGAKQYDLASQEDTTGMIFSMIMPMLLMMFLYSGCVSVAPESIAGEKERGTIATMLITPIRREDIAIGKILALAVIALLSGASSALGTILSLPKLMAGAMDGMNTNIYGISDYALLAAVILSTVLLMVTMISILSCFARTVKEAQTSAVPLQILVTLIGASTMFGGSAASTQLWKYAIPLYNSAQCITGVFSFTITPTAVALTVGVNLALTVIGVVALTRMFHSEKIIFSK